MYVISCDVRLLLYLTVLFFLIIFFSMISKLYEVSGGALQIGKGIGKGITTGDGMAVVDGLSKGASSLGGGISQGAESAVMGAADGLLSAGKGIFSGVKNVGQGIGGAIRGKKPPSSQLNRNSTAPGGHGSNSNNR
jgi:phage-related protein